MKTIYLLLALGTTCYLQAQDLSSIHDKVQVTDVVADAWTATLNDNPDFYQKTFEDFTKREFGVKSKNDGKNQEVVKKISIPQIIDKRGDLRLTFFTEGSETKLALIFLLGYDIWINPQDYPEGMEQMRKLTGDYLKFHYMQYYQNQMEDNEKLIDKHRRDINRSENTIANLRKQIKKNEDRLSQEITENKRASLNRKNQQNLLEINQINEEIPDLYQQIAVLDEKVIEIKETIKQVEAEYNHDYNMMAPPLPRSSENLVQEASEVVEPFNDTEPGIKLLKEDLDDDL